MEEAVGCYQHFDRAVVRCLIPLAVMALAAGCGDQSGRPNRPPRNVVTGGDYGPVTPDMLSGAIYTGRTGRGDEYDDLTWTFAEDTFLIKGGANGIPPGVREKLLPDGVEAQVIEGNWSVANDVITFSNIKADGDATDGKPRQLETMFTGVLRIVADEQYKFHRGQPK